MADFHVQTTFRDEPLDVVWGGTSQIWAHSFICGNCGKSVSENDGYTAVVRHLGTTTGRPAWSILICHHCGMPSSFRLDEQVPGPPFGNEVEHLPDDVKGMFKEARECCKVNSFTAAVLCCRKLLMHIAVSKGAESGKSFLDYVNYLADSGYVPPDGKGWVDHIRQKGNEANHEIVIMRQKDARDLITFSEMLLKMIYEFPAMIAPPPSEPEPEST